MGPLPNGLNSWFVNGGDPNYLLIGDDPPSSRDPFLWFLTFNFNLEVLLSSRQMAAAK